MIGLAREAQVAYQVRFKREYYFNQVLPPFRCSLGVTGDVEYVHNSSQPKICHKLLFPVKFCTIRLATSFHLNYF